MSTPSIDSVDQLHSVVERLVVETGRSALTVLSMVYSVVKQDLHDCVDPDERMRLLKLSQAQQSRKSAIS